MFCLKITILNSVELQVCDSLKEASENLYKKLDQTAGLFWLLREFSTKK